MERDHLGYPALYATRGEGRTTYRVWRTLAHILTVLHVRPTGTPTPESTPERQTDAPAQPSHWEGRA